MKKMLALALLVLALAAVGCGGDDEGEEAPEEAGATPSEAIAEIGEVRQGLDDALAAYEEGDAAQAEELAAEAYLEHFELVEPPLEERNEELNEELEHLIREDVRGAIAKGAPEKEVESLIEEANDGLDRAEKEFEK